IDRVGEVRKPARDFSRLDVDCSHSAFSRTLLSLGYEAVTAEGKVLVVWREGKHTYEKPLFTTQFPLPSLFSRWHFPDGEQGVFLSCQCCGRGQPFSVRRKSYRIILIGGCQREELFFLANVPNDQGVAILRRLRRCEFPVRIADS